MPEQVALWSALLAVQDTGYSGRLKKLLHSGRPVPVVDRVSRLSRTHARLPTSRGRRQCHQGYLQ